MRGRGVLSISRTIGGSPNRRSIVLGFIDQAFSSATNFGLSLVAGRLLGPSGLGEVFLGFSVYLVGLGLQRRLLTEPLVASTAGGEAEQLRVTTGMSLTVSIVAGVGATALVLAAGLVLPGLPGEGLLLIAPWLVPLLLQDVIRSVLFRDSRPGAAAANDCVWFIVMALAVVPAWRIGTAEGIMACWAFGALAACVVGLVQVAAPFRSPGAALRWWRRDALPFGKWNAGAAIVSQVGSNGGVFILSVILGAASLGGLRAAQSVFAPLTLVIPAISLPGLPIVARAVSRDLRWARNLSIRLSVIAFAATFAYVTLIALGGWRLLPFLFGESFARFTDLIWPIAVAQLVTSAGVGLLLLLRAERRGRDLLVNRAITAAASVALIAILALRYGLLGAAWGTAGASLISLILLVYVTFVPASPSGRRRLPPST
jgi:O-antigen/teichoic acid export membrane protein